MTDLSASWFFKTFGVTPMSNRRMAIISFQIAQDSRRNAGPGWRKKHVEMHLGFARMWLAKATETLP